MAIKAPAKALELSPKQKRELLEDGYTMFPGAVSKDKLDAALRRVNNRLGQGTRAGPEAAGSVSDYWMENVSSPEVMDLLFKTPVWGLAESLVGPGRLERPPEAQVALRFPSLGDKEERPAFHIDGFYAQPTRKASSVFRFTMLAGVLLNDLPGGDMGNFVVCPGSHRLIADFVKKKGLAPLERGLQDKIKLPDAVPITGKAGDAFLAHYQLAHDKGPNASPRIRYMVYFRLRHKDHLAHKNKPFTDLWLEWPGLKGAA